MAEKNQGTIVKLDNQDLKVATTGQENVAAVLKANGQYDTNSFSYVLNKANHETAQLEDEMLEHTLFEPGDTVVVIPKVVGGQYVGR